MSLTILIQNHRMSLTAIVDEDASAETRHVAHRWERSAARAIVMHRPTSLEEVRTLAAYAAGEELTAEDKAELFRSLAA